MLQLPSTPLLNDFQEYVKLLEEQRGFTQQGIKDKCLLLGEEIGELFKAIRKKEGLKIDKTSHFSDISDELADILIYLCAIANRYDIDLETAFRKKEEKNKQRFWD